MTFKRDINALNNQGSNVLCRLKKYFEKLWVDTPGLEDPTKEESVFKTLVHGDAHVNNIMFSSNDPNAEELRLIYQLVYWTLSTKYL